MKKSLSLILVLLIALSFASCGKKQPAEDAAQKASQTVTEAPQKEDGSQAEAGQATQSQATMPPESETVQKVENAPAGENRFTFSGISLILPQNFAISNEADAVMAYAPDGPAVGDVINFIRGEAVDPSAYTKDILDATFKENVPGYTGMKRYETGTAAGAQSIVMGYDVERDGTPFHITQVMLFFSDRSLALTYTDASGKYAKDFEESIKSIKAE